MSEEKQLPVVFNDAQRNIILMQTPPDEIEWRAGPKGKMVPYVKIGYVIETLNLGLGFDWDFDILSHEYHEELDEIIVLGKLTVRGNGRAVSKTQFGSAKVQRYDNTNKVICLADDHKAAASDCLKKCASLLGVAHDVYRGQVENGGDEATTAKTTRKPAKRARKAAPKPGPRVHWIDDPKIRRRFWAWVKTDLGLDEDTVHAILGVEHLRDYAGTKAEAHAAITAALDLISAEMNARHNEAEEGEIDDGQAL